MSNKHKQTKQHQHQIQPNQNTKQYNTQHKQIKAYKYRKTK